MMQFFKKLWKDFTWDEIDQWREEELQFIKENRKKAEDNLAEKGWKILSVNERLMVFGYKITNNTVIAEVTIREALNI